MTLSSDAVSYLDIGGFFWHGHWSTVVNGLWNPLYPIILGVTIGLCHPSVYWEFPLIHLVLFLIYLVALACFDFFLHELIQLRRREELSSELSIPEWFWLAVGFVLFLWSSLWLIKVSEPNPDMLVAAFYYLALGLIVRICREAAGWPTFLAFGLTLGLGYLTKSVMFPVAIICIAVALCKARRRTAQVLASIAVFVLVSSPYVVALSLNKGRITIGDSGSYNYAIHVEGIPQFHWQGKDADSREAGRPAHPTRQIVEWPATFEFATPIGGTYPPWTDPSYWHEGMKPHFSLREAVRVASHLLTTEFSMLLGMHGAIVAAVFIMLGAGGRGWRMLQDIGRYWFLIVPSLAVLLAYAMVHVESRYLGPFLATLVLALFFAVRFPASESYRSLCLAVAVFLVVMYLLPFDAPSLNVKGFLKDISGRSQARVDVPSEVVKAMYALGLKAGDRIASLQESDNGMSTWACLAHVQIIAEVYYWPTASQTLQNNFWQADKTTQQRVIQAFAKTGVSFVVSELPPENQTLGWKRVGNSEYYAYPIWVNDNLASRR